MVRRCVTWTWLPPATRAWYMTSGSLPMAVSRVWFSEDLEAPGSPMKRMLRLGTSSRPDANFARPLLKNRISVSRSKVAMTSLFALRSTTVKLSGRVRPLAWPVQGTSTVKTCERPNGPTAGAETAAA